LDEHWRVVQAPGFTDALKAAMLGETAAFRFNFSCCR
jgi:hypothetical protein